MRLSNRKKQSKLNLIQSNLKSKILFLTLSFLLIPAGFARYASAELVLTRLNNEQVGHGWLFGSHIDASCWLAAPAHVLRGIDGRLKMAIIQRGDGVENHLAALPVQPDPSLDLAFAPISVDGECHDRLGLKDATNLIQTTDKVALNVLMAAGKEGVNLKIRSMTHNRHEITVEPVNAKDKLMQGFSGGLIHSPRSGIGGRNIPLGMLLRVCDINMIQNIEDDFKDNSDDNFCDNEHHYGVAVRFDKIRKEFEKYVNFKLEKETYIIHNTSSLKVELLASSGKTIDAEQGPRNSFFIDSELPSAQINSLNPVESSGAVSNRFQKKMCWNVLPAEFGKVTATLRITGGDLHQVKVYPCPGAGEGEGPLGIGIQAKDEDSTGWSMLHYCHSLNGNNAPLIDCKFLPYEGADRYLFEFKGQKTGKALSIGRVVIN